MHNIIFDEKENKLILRQGCIHRPSPDPAHWVHPFFLEKNIRIEC